MANFNHTLIEILNTYSIELNKHHSQPNLDAELCMDLSEPNLNSSYIKFKCYEYDSKTISSLFNQLGLKKCKKIDATKCLYIGTLGDYGEFLGKPKHYWLTEL